jgi:hypothetical protein
MEFLILCHVCGLLGTMYWKGLRRRSRDLFQDHVCGAVDRAMDLQRPYCSSGNAKHKVK